MSKMRQFIIEIRPKVEGQGVLDQFGVKNGHTPEADWKAFFYKKLDQLRASGLPIEELEKVTKFEVSMRDNRAIVEIFDKDFDGDDKAVKLKLREFFFDTMKVPRENVSVTVKEPKVCASCDGPVDEDNGTSTPDGKPLCYPCYESDTSEPAATVVYSDEDEYPHTIGDYHNDTEGDFELAYHHTDAWRGHYSVTPSKDWAELHSDAILSMSEDERELKRFDELLQEALKDLGIRYARVFTRTSNLFCSGYDFFVEKKKLKKAEGIASHLKSVLRDPVRFTTTALTGKDPKDITNTDRLFAAMASRIMKNQG